MIKRGLVQEKVMDFNSRKLLPPLKTLPHWPRGMLDKTRYPKPFVKDKNLEPLDVKTTPETENKLTVDITNMNPVQYITHLERSIAFIRSQHSDVLHCLHREIEKLKRDNKDLNLKIIMTQHPTVNRETRDEGNGSVAVDSNLPMDKQIDDKKQMDDLKIVFLEDEIKQLKQAVREANNRSFYMAQGLEKTEDQKRQLQALVDRLQYQQQQKAVKNGFTMEKLPQEMKPDSITDASNRAPTLSECELIIRHLRKVNEKQSHELDSLKSDLRDVLYSHKWTPDAYLLAKAYVAADDAKNNSQLPDLPTRKMPDIAYVQHDSVTLPALKQTVGNKSLERRKRMRILQKARLNKDMVPPEINIAP